MASRRCRLIAILPAIETAMYSIFLIIAKFGHSSGYFHINSFVLCYFVKLGLHVRSLRLLHIPTISYAFVLLKFTLCNMWQRSFPTTFHSNPLSIHIQMWIGSIRFGFSHLQCVGNQCGFDTHPMPSADTPFDFLLALVLSASHFTFFLYPQHAVHSL